MIQAIRLMICFLAACAIATAVTPLPAKAGEKLLVFAAASLKTALDKVDAACGPATISYAATSALAKQIEQGAPADIFFSADMEWMGKLADQKLIRPETGTNLLGNEIVLVAPAASAATIPIAPGFDLAGLLGDGKLAMANVDAVPAGRYGKAALETLGALGWSERQRRTGGERPRRARSRRRR